MRLGQILGRRYTSRATRKDSVSQREPLQTTRCLWMRLVARGRCRFFPALPAVLDPRLRQVGRFHGCLRLWIDPNAICSCFSSVDKLRGDGVMDVSRATRFVHSLLVPVRLEHRLGLSRNLKGKSVGIPFQASGFDPRRWKHPRRNGLGPGEVNIVRVNRTGMRFDTNAQWLHCEAWRERSGAHQRTFARRGRGMDASTSLHASRATFLVRRRGRIAPAVPSFTLLPFTTQFTTFRGRSECRNPVPFIRGCLIGQSGSWLLSIWWIDRKTIPFYPEKEAVRPKSHGCQATTAAAVSLRSWTGETVCSSQEESILQVQG